MTTPTSLSPAVFLDRDGTINVEKDYLHRIEDFAFIPGAEAAIKRLKEAGFLVIVVTNQSGVARGYFPREAVCRLHEHLQQCLNKVGSGIDDFYICPHHPTEGQGEYQIDCDCRKGSPGMLLQAAVDHGIDLAKSWMVGDKLADIEAGVAAGCQPILVRTGYGAEDESRVASRFPHAQICKDLTAAAEMILSTA